ncbi:hypothetical protein MIND_00734300 [Mycena indigotica]|uniref:STB6-like N-terminal domain-containing protein n=1 Tax=Mycena indigotica TaxID=2126181 RepID=A0A8H6SMD0_9AGAR|nr:uncharacterized protein MIND_00734300 [Mycena indigotica]KAF7301688.1 hypothetical protein MIND_00734300 [Mycena indigotica]
MNQTLLLPTVRKTQTIRAAPHHTHHRTHSKLSRPSTSSVDLAPAQPRPTSPTEIAQQWIGLPLHFDIVTDRVQLEGYQIYAVEKWITERDRPVTCLTVYTGDPAHKITVTALKPSPSLSPTESAAEWEKAISHLRRDARPRETAHGLVFATSLAHFRSDFTIVQIPDGDFLQARDQLYTNINLLRMGCSGRSALTLEEPSETTKDRFIATYHLPDSILSGTANLSPNPTTPTASPAASPQPSPAKHRTHSSVSVPTNESPQRRAAAGLRIAPPTPSLNVGFGVTSPTPATTPGGRIGTKSKSRADRTLFSASVLELVRLLQASLAIFGLFSVESHGLDGLLCDKTVEGLDMWVTQVGEQSLNLEATERIADPHVVCALLSLVLSTRNKLVTLLSTSPPKDPFLRPQAFISALSLYSYLGFNGQGNSSHGSSTPATPAFPFLSGHNYSHSLPTTPGLSSAFPMTSKSYGLGLGPPPNMTRTVLTQTLVEGIAAAYSEKARAGERRRSRGARALLGFDGEVDETLSGGEGGEGVPDTGGGQILTGIGSLVGLNINNGASGAAGIMEASVDLEAFVRVVVGRAKERGKRRSGKEREGRGADNEEKEIVNGVAGCVRGLWSGHISTVVALRERELDESSIPPRGSNDRKPPLIGSDNEDNLRGEKDGRSTEEEGPSADKWGGRVQKKFESWTRLNRGVKKGHASIDLGGRDSLDGSYGIIRSRKRPPLPMRGLVLPPGQRDIDGGEDLSSGQVSPITDDPRTPRPLEPSLSATSSNANLLNSEEFERKLSAFNHKSPWGNRIVQNRISSWSDPVSAREIIDSEESDDSGGTGEEGSGLSDRNGKRRHPPPVRERAASRLAQSSVFGEPDDVIYEEPMDAAGYLSDAPPETSPKRKQATATLTRRRSWHHDSASFRDLKILSIDRMRIDVALCGQVLVLLRRAEHLRNVLACVHVLTSSLSETNTILREDYQTHVKALASVEQQARIIAEIDAEGSKTDKISQAQNTLSYETQQLVVQNLWHVAGQPRQTTFALRDKVFGMGGRRLPTGKYGAHGQFNRLQWTLDSRKYLVDYLGRTESEAEEESLVDPEAIQTPPPIEDKEVVTHPSIRPMWLLRFFTSWGAKWATQPDVAQPEQPSGIQLASETTSAPQSRTSL